MGGDNVGGVADYLRPEMPINFEVDEQGAGYYTRRSRIISQPFLVKSIAVDSEFFSSNESRFEVFYTRNGNFVYNAATTGTSEWATRGSGGAVWFNSYGPWYLRTNELILEPRSYIYVGFWFENVTPRCTLTMSIRTLSASEVKAIKGL